MITMIVVVKVKPEKREEFLQALRSLNGEQEGLKKFTLYQEIDEHTGLSLTYEWEAQEDCDRYLVAEKFRVLLGAFKVLCEKSEIRCGNISEKLPDLAHGTFDRVSEPRTGSEKF
jgi:quinol monooxygenase YgiN